ncbi:hypothetical protein [Noviherbaspirillum humi]|uniref:hypothetical protein n=1 Tax=Noviherbaspirillum humi TaxID=1688639 RepID=UPI0011609D71|nr:hypothetical protein [Noviherbaspirillum humi]
MKASARYWIFGTFVVYARSAQLARKVYEEQCAKSLTEPFGVVALDTGDEVIWLNLESPGLARQLFH